MGTIVEHLALGALNDPAVNARAGEAHPNELPDRGLIDQLVRDDVVERPVHVRQIDVNEHASDLHAARARRIETVKHALLGSHDPSESRPALICVPRSAEKLQAVLRDHHGEDTEHDETP